MTTSLQEDKFYSRNSFPFKVPHGVPKDNTIAIKKKKDLLPCHCSAQITDKPAESSSNQRKN